MSGKDAVADGAYEVRFGWTRWHLIALPGLTLLVAHLVWASEQEDLWDDHGWRESLWRLLESAPRPVEVGVYLAMAALTGLAGISVVATALSGRVALRVDRAGLTLGAPPPWTRRYTVHVPWSRIRTVYLWKTRTGLHIGLRRRKGARPLPWSPRPWTLARRGVAIGVVDYHRVIDSSLVDRDRLAKAITRFAPRVELVLVDKNGAVTA